jgi:hypothetical protein
MCSVALCSVALCVVYIEFVSAMVLRFRGIVGAVALLALWFDGFVLAL